MIDFKPKIEEEIDFQPIDFQPETTSRGFSQKYQPMVEERSRKIQDISEANLRGEQGFARSAFQTGGQLLGGAFDPFLAGAKAYTPEIIKKPIRWGLKSIGEGVKDIAGVISDIPAVQRFAMTPQSQITERDIEAINEYLVLLAPEAKGISPVFGKTLTKIGTTVEESGLKSLSTLKDKFIRELTRPEKTARVKLAEVGRTTETGVGAFKRSIIEPTVQENRMMQEVSKIPEISKAKTYQQNYNIISEANINEARILKQSLLKNDFIYSPEELMTKIQEARIRLSESPVLVGDASKSADKMIAKIEQLISQSDGKGSSLLDVRKKYDNWIQSQKGEGIFDPARESPMSIANREIRQTINTFLDEKAVNVEVKTSLKRQSALYGALENIAPKASKEADTAVMRAFESMQKILGTKSRLVQISAALVGIGGLGAAATFAPAALGIGATTFIMYQGGKLVLKPQFRLLLGVALKKIGSSLTKEEVSIIKSLLSTETIIHSKEEIYKKQ